MIWSSCSDSDDRGDLAGGEGEGVLCGELAGDDEDSELLDRSLQCCDGPGLGEGVGLCSGSGVLASGSICSTGSCLSWSGHPPGYA